MAAFEAVSKVTVKPQGLNAEIDLRTVTLLDNPPVNDGYNPREHRMPKNPITPLLAYSNMLRLGVNNALLAMPLVMCQGGLIWGPVLMLGTGLLMIHTNILLLDCLNEVCRQLRVPYISFRYGFRIALLHGPSIFHRIGKNGPAIIAALMVTSQMGVCAVIVTYSSESLRDVMDWQLKRTAVEAMLFPFLMIVYYMKTFKVISYMSTIGLVLNMTGIVIIYYKNLSDTHGFDLTPSTNINRLTYSTGYLLFYLSTLNLVLSMDRALPDPSIMVSKYGVITVGMTILSVHSVIFSIMGSMYTGALDVNIIRSFPYDEDITMVVISLYTLGVISLFPLMCYPAIQVIVEVVKYRSLTSIPCNKTLMIVERISRPIFVIICFVLSYWVPLQAPFIVFVGNTTTSLLAIVFPAMMDISLRYPNSYGKHKLNLIKNVMLILLGLILATCGTILSGEFLYTNFMYSRNHWEY